MEDAQGILCADVNCLGDVVTEKGLVASKEPVAHVQLACSTQYCAFPVDGNMLCVWSTEDPSYQVSRKSCVCFLRSDDMGSLALTCPLLGRCPGDSAPGNSRTSCRRNANTVPGVAFQKVNCLESPR
ncbi:unnamed protein product [Gulo gulo]|uniref:Uncharacterized protein n=1 Tax=Gulo gulo TaxID=48420 RepID=A0A9X9LRJ3_GULGU|nr:unnamed protein product [Gulo gulo]